MKSFLKKFKKKEDSTDVNRTTTKRLSTAQLAHRLSMIENERGNWTGKFDFFLSCLGYAVGLGNVWRFPYLCYKNGGAVFFIPYICMLIFLGIPIFLLELTIGQFTSRGPLNCWEMAPLFKGIGVGMLLVSGSVAIYYNVIIAWAMFYMVASFKSVLPWTSCNNPWNSVGCYDKSWLTPDNCTSAGYTHFLLNGTCMGNNTLYGYTNVTMATLANIKPVSAAEDYMKCHVLGNCYSEGIGDLGPINWKMALCLLGAWVLIFLCLCRGIKSSGRVVYFTALFPYVVLLILLIRGLTLEGHEDGIYFYIRNVNWDKLKDITVWKEAASQIFFSLSTSWGGLIALSSYNKFHNNIMRDAILIPILNCATSLFAGFVIFSFLGYLAHMTNTSVDKVVDHGPGLAFIAYPYAVSTMPLPQIWAVLFFVMLITLGMDSQFTLIETIATSVMDSSPKMRNYKTILFAVLCSILFLPGLIMCTNGGSYVLTLMDTYIGSWNLLLLAIFECICIGYVYGTENFSKDLVCILSADINLCSTYQKCLNVGDTVEGNIENYEIFEKEEIKKDAEKMNLKMQNIGDDVKNNIISNEKHCSSIKCVKVRQNNSNSYSLKFWKITSIWWIVCWKIITPLGITFVMIFSWIKYNRTKDGDYIFPLYAEAIGWSMTIFIVLCGFVTSVIILFTRKGPFRIKLQKSLKPSVNYKPDLPKHQLLAKHLPFYSREFICLENNVVI